MTSDDGAAIHRLVWSVVVESVEEEEDDEEQAEELSSIVGVSSLSRGVVVDCIRGNCCGGGELSLKVNVTPFKKCISQLGS